MAPSSRDRISVDLQGLRAVLFERSKAVGVSPSGLVRQALVDALGTSEVGPSQQVRAPLNHDTGDRVRVTVRVTREQATELFAAAQRNGLSPGAYIAGLVAEVPALTNGGGRRDHIAALVASSAELSALSRNIHQLMSLLREGNVRPALQYRAMLDTLAIEVRGHLQLASRMLVDLQPRRRSSLPRNIPPPESEAR